MAVGLCQGGAVGHLPAPPGSRSEVASIASMCAATPNPTPVAGKSSTEAAAPGHPPYSPQPGMSVRTSRVTALGPPWLWGPLLPTSPSPTVCDNRHLGNRRLWLQKDNAQSPFLENDDDDSKHLLG